MLALILQTSKVLTALNTCTTEVMRIGELQQTHLWPHGVLLLFYHAHCHVQHPPDAFFSSPFCCTRKHLVSLIGARARWKCSWCICKSTQESIHMSSQSVRSYSWKVLEAALVLLQSRNLQYMSFICTCLGNISHSACCSGLALNQLSVYFQSGSMCHYHVKVATCVIVWVKSGGVHT